MNICLLSTLGGAIGKLTVDFINEIIKSRDVQISLYLLDRRNDYSPNDLNVNVEYCTTIKNALFAKASSFLKLAIKKINADIIHCNYVSNAAFIRKNSHKIILTMHGPPRPEIEVGIGNKLAYKLEQISISLMSKDITVVTISEYSRNLIQRIYGIDCKVIYNGINTQFYSPSLAKVQLKRDLGVQDCPMILYVGRLHPLKDPLTLINAFSIISKKLPNSVLFMVGSGPLKAQVENLIQKNKMRIKLIDSAYGLDLLRLYQAADIFVLPSIGESFGLVIAEAMASGCICLGTTSGAPAELIGNNDLLFRPANSTELANKIIWLLDHPSETVHISKCLRSRAESLFSIKKMADSYQDLYRHVLTQH